MTRSRIPILPFVLYRDGSRTSLRSQDSGGLESREGEGVQEGGGGGGEKWWGWVGETKGTTPIEGIWTYSLVGNITRFGRTSGYFTPTRSTSRVPPLSVYPGWVRRVSLLEVSASHSVSCVRGLFTPISLTEGTLQSFSLLYSYLSRNSRSLLSAIVV